jgi:hypothetical protein
MYFLTYSLRYFGTIQFVRHACLYMTLHLNVFTCVILIDVLVFSFFLSYHLIVNIERICSIICPFVHCDKNREKLCGSSKRWWLLKVELIIFFSYMFIIFLCNLLYTCG